VVVMIEADKGWKETFHEHLYEKLQYRQR
jgi:hypothetical protein